jgi:predicted deacylase
MGKPSIIVEAGGGGRLTEDAVQYITNGINNVMKKLKMIEGVPTPTEKPRIRYRPMVYVNRGGLLYTPPLGTRVKKGDNVGEVRNIFGDLLETLHSPVNGVIIFRRSPLPVSKNDKAVAIISDEDIPPPKSRPHP